MHRLLAALVLLLCACSLFGGDAPFTLLNWPDTGPKTLTGVATPEIAVPITFEEKLGKKAVVLLDPVWLASESGVAVQAKWPSQVALAPYAVQTLLLQATLPVPSTYTGAIRTTIGSGKTATRKTYVISVARTGVATPITVESIPAKQLTRDFSGNVKDETIDVSVAANGGPLVLSKPLVLTRTRRTKAEATAAAIASGMTVTPADESIRPEPGNPANLHATIGNFEQAGRYDATLRFAPPGYTAVDVPLTVYVRDSPLRAFLFILLGVLVSLGVHAWGIARPRLLQQQRVIGWRDQITRTKAAAADDHEAAGFVDDVSRAIEKKWKNARRQFRTASTELDVYDVIVPALADWVRLHRQLIAVRPASVRGKLMPQLDEIRTQFLAETPDAAQVSAGLTTMRTLVKTIRDEVAAAVREQATHLDTVLQNDHRLEAIQLRSSLAGVFAALDAGAVEKATGALDVIGLQYVTLNAADLRARVAPDAAAPVGIHPDDWAKLKAATTSALDDVSRQTDAEAASAALQNAYRTYMRSVAQALTSTAEKEAAGAVPAVAAALQPLEGALAEGDMQTAWDALERARTALESESGQDMGALESITAAAPALTFDILQIADLPATWEWLGTRFASVVNSASITLFDVLVSVLVLAIAAAIGLQTLWADNPVWGGWLAYLAAFLWGFAADQFTHAGVLALRKG